MCVNNDTNGIAQKSEQCEQQKNRFIFTSYSCTEHTRRQRWCALIPVKTEWYLETGRNEARNYVYVISNRRLKTNWGQHWDAVWRWLNRFLTVFERKWNVWNFCGRHSHTQQERESVCVCKIIAIRTYLGMEFSIRQTRTNEWTNQPTNQPIFYHVSFCCRHFFAAFPFSVSVMFCWGRDGENWHARTRNIRRVRVCVSVWSDFYICSTKKKKHYMDSSIARIGCVLVSD